MPDHIIVPRIPDIPYFNSPAHQFVFSQTAFLNGGQYVFDGTKAVLDQQPNLIKDALYYFRHITLTADTSARIYESAIGSAPAFTPEVPRVQFFFAQGTGAPVFKTPIVMNTFLESWDYPLFWQNQQSPQILTANWIGKIRQTADLIGKSQITLKIVVSATEITDESYVNDFIHRPYPKRGNEGELPADTEFNRHFRNPRPSLPIDTRSFPEPGIHGGF